MKLKSGEFLGQKSRHWKADGVLVSEIAYPAKVFEGWHYHENHHISFIIKGGNREQRKKAEREILPSMLVSYQSGELHRNYNTDRQSKNINLEIEEDFLIRYGVNAELLNFTGSSYAHAKFTLLKIYKECLAADPLFTTALHSLLLGLWKGGDSSTGPMPKWVTLLRELLNDHWNENISLEELARIVQVHPVTISKFFPRYFHCTLGEYIRQLRIQKAIQLVHTTDQSLTSIACHCGFFDQSHFIRVFKESTGFLPGAYKKLAG